MTYVPFDVDTVISIHGRTYVVVGRDGFMVRLRNLDGFDSYFDVDNLRSMRGTGPGHRLHAGTTRPEARRGSPVRFSLRDPLVLAVVDRTVAPPVAAIAAPLSAGALPGPGPAPGSPWFPVGVLRLYDEIGSTLALMNVFAQGGILSVRHGTVIQSGTYCEAVLFSDDGSHSVPADLRLGSSSLVVGGTVHIENFTVVGVPWVDEIVARTRPPR